MYNHTNALTHTHTQTHIAHRCDPKASPPQDAENEKKELPFKHQHEISENMGEVEGLLQALFLDVDKARKMQHPQASEISNE